MRKQITGWLGGLWLVLGCSLAGAGGNTVNGEINVLNLDGSVKKYRSDVVVFLDQAGNAPALYSIIRNPNLAKALRLIQAQGKDAYYKGDIAAALGQLARNLGAGERHPLQVMASLQAHFGRMLTELWRVLAPGGLFFARLASNIGLERVLGERAAGALEDLGAAGVEMFLRDLRHGADPNLDVNRTYVLFCRDDVAEPFDRRSDHRRARLAHGLVDDVRRAAVVRARDDGVGGVPVTAALTTSTDNSPLCGTCRFGMSPACPSPDIMPCLWPPGLKCPPAESNGASHLPTA